jgi:phospho-N-acetylmuramoyl-pentapeptide-transferase
MNGSLLWPLLFGFVAAAAGGAAVLALLRGLRLQQHAYEDAPETHQKKTGTPTMGGVVFVLALLPLAFSPGLPLAVQTFFVVAACGAIGFCDDFLSIRRGKNQGLRARTKFLASALVAVLFLRLCSDSNAIFPRDVLFHAGTTTIAAPHWLWLLLGICAITGTIHAVNLTDGLDGLATGAAIPPLAVMAYAAGSAGVFVPQEAALLGVGACFGFLLYNRHPAKMFMGDTGSLALGALLSSVAILSGQMLLLILVGGVFVAEALSVIVQVAYFKASGGKRIFRMSPLHHHFELGGWPETKVTGMFWAASLGCSLLGLALVR